MRGYSSRIALASLLCLVVFGCAPLPRNQKWYIADLPSSSEPAASSKASLSSPPAAKVRLDVREWLWLGRLFRSKELRGLKSLDNLDSILAPENPHLTRGLRRRQGSGELDTALVPKNYTVTRITHCDSAILKAFVDAGWWSLVLLESTPWLVVGYDASGNVILEDPRGHTESRRSVTDFQRAWKLPSPGQCVLITLEKLDKHRARKTLQRYLPPSKVSQIHIQPLERPNPRTASKC